MQDLKFAVRQLLKHPGFRLVAVLSLGLGVSVNTMMFSFFNAYLLRPVPLIKEPNRVLEINRAEIAICLSLLIGAGLLLRAGQKAGSVAFNYETEKVLLARFDLRRHGYDLARTAEFHRQLLERMKSLPGVQSASLARHTFAGREHVDTVSPDASSDPSGAQVY